MMLPSIRARAKMIERPSKHGSLKATDHFLEAAMWKQARFGLAAKIILLGAGWLIPLAALTWFISVESLRRNMTQEFTSKGVSIARGLATAAVDPILTRDASTVQALVDQYVGNSGVAYVLVYDARNAIIAHTFVPRVPPELIKQARGAGTQSEQVREIRYADPATGAERQIIDAAVPMLAGRLGVVRVGMDQAIITAAVTRAGNALLLLFAAIAALSTAAAALFARRVTRPLKRLTDVATRVGRGDLSQLVPITSRDEVGLLTATFNDTVVRLRSQLQTEAERDELRKLTRYMEQAYRVSTAMQEALSLKELITRVLAAAQEVVALDRLQSWIITRQGDALAYRASAGLSQEDETSIGQKLVIPLAEAGAMAKAYHDMRTLAFDEANPLPAGLYLRPPYSEVKALRSKRFVVLPMITSGRSVGVLVADNKYSRVPIPAHTLEMLPTFASHAAVAVDNIRLFRQLQSRTQELARTVEELTALAEVGRAVSSTLELDSLLAIIISRGNQLAGTDGGLIYEYDEVTEELHLRATQNFEQELVTTLRVQPLRKGQGVGGRVVETRAPFQVPDITAQGAYRVHIRDILIRAGYRALLAVPLVLEQQIIGAFLVGRKQPGMFPADVIELLTTFASQSALAIQNARLFRALEHKSHELEEASRHKSQFLANMSHELRTPLNAIIGFSEVLHERMFGELSEKQAEYVADIHSSGQHLLSLINDILDLSKIEAGHMELSPSEFDVRAAVDNAVTLVRERATRHGVKLELELDDGLERLFADERKFKQILLNLLSNAVKFTPPGGSVKLQVEKVDDEVLVSVIDDGIGIAPADQELIFEEFRQVATNERNKPEGTGLGLALTKKFVEMHGGRIWVRSEVGKGSTFTFSLGRKSIAGS